MSAIKVSIIVPIYNVEKYLSKCLNSLITQTLKDIEIICINDGSTDDSLSILQEYVQKDCRIKIINKENEGQGVARNIGIKVATGVYVGFVDPDDFVQTDMFEKMYNQAVELDSDIVICDFVKQNETTRKIEKFKFFKKAITPTKTQTIKIEQNKNIALGELYKTLLVSPNYSWNRIYKRELIQKYNIEFSICKSFEDCSFIFKTHNYADRISYINKPLYSYTIRRSSTSRDYSDLLSIYEDIADFVKTINRAELYKINLSYFIVMNSVFIYRTLTEDRKAEFYKVLENKLSPEELIYFRKKLHFRENILSSFIKFCRGRIVKNA